MSKRKWFTRKIDRLVMGAIIGAAVGSVVGASLRKKKQQKEKEPIEWFEAPEQEKRGFFARLFGRAKKRAPKHKEEIKEIPDESHVE